MSLHPFGARSVDVRRAGRRKNLSFAAPDRRRRAAKRRLKLETLESRTLCAVDFRSLDGTGNNLQNPQWGSTGEEFVRRAAAEYGDGASTPAGADRPSARAVSNAVAAQNGADLPNDRQMSAFIYAWGQFLDHDLDLTDTATPVESFPIAIPQGDVWFDPFGTGDKTIDLSRSVYNSETGDSPADPRQQVNALTAFVDASQVYGVDAERAAALRTFVGGRLQTSAGDLLPFNTDGLPNAAIGGDPADYFLAGDVRANENPELLALQTLFVREHNRLAGSLAAAHPDWSDEKLYQEARRVVAAEMQAITYNEFLPALLGRTALRSYQGYRPQVNPGISNEFATAAFRLGHSMLGEDVEFLDNQGRAVRDPVALRDAFFNVDLVKETGIDPILKYLASDHAQEIDVRVIDDVRNFLFGPPGSGGLDLASLNIQRGRDHGLADYNSVRAAYGLPRVTSFEQITSDPQLQAALRETYGDVDRIDLWVGGLAEDHVSGASVGPTFQRILADQFQRLRDGDRFWYERDFQGEELRQIRRTTLADVIRRNTSTTNLQDDVFFFRTSVSGRIVNDANANGRLESREQGLAGVVVELYDDRGGLVATARTARDGRYRFDGLELGVYEVRVVGPAGFRQTTAAPPSIVVTRGQSIERLDVGFAASRNRSSAPPAPLQDLAIDQLFPTAPVRRR